MEIRKLNTLRGIAALIVVVSHYSNATLLMGGVLGHGGGQFGVMLFFTLSGFLMSHLYLGREFSAPAAAMFAASRVARVMPLFLVMVFASYVTCKTGLGAVFYYVPDRGAIVSHVLLLSGVSVFWTIPPEMQFYALFAGLWWLYSKRPAYLYFAAAVLVTACALNDFTQWEAQFQGARIEASIIKAMPYLMGGVLLGRLYHSWQVPQRLRRDVFAFAPLLLVLLYPEFYLTMTGHDHAMWREPLVFFCVMLVFFAVLFLTPDDNAILCNPVGDFLGRISFSVYLLHDPLQRILASWCQQSPALFLLVYLPACMVVASISYCFIEAPARSAIRLHARNLIESRGRTQREQLSRS